MSHQPLIAFPFRGPPLLQQTNWLNDYKILIHVFQLQLQNGQCLSTIYGCNRCGKMFVSKTGAKEHKCNILVELDFDSDRILRHKLAIHDILVSIATYNLPFTAAEGFAKPLNDLDPTFFLPQKDKLHDLMLDLAKEIQIQMFNELRSQKVSLMVDGCQRWGVNYEGIIIYTHKRLYLLSVMAPDDTKSVTLARVISNAIQICKMHRIEVVAVNTDNAANNIAAFDENNDLSVQNMASLQVIREPCAAHTMNLAVEDMFSKDQNYTYVTSCITKLVSNAPPNPKRKRRNPPKYLKIRWMSLYDCVSFIFNNKEYYANSTNEDVQEAYTTVETNIGWFRLKEMLRILKIFLMHAESDAASIADIVDPYLIACEELEKMTSKSSAAKALLFHFRHRFLTTCPLLLPFAAYLLTKKGLITYRYGFISHKDSILSAAINGITTYMQEKQFPPAVIELVKEQFLWYLQYFNENLFDSYPIADEMWANNKEFCEGFKQLATDLLLIPSSEAAVERLFSALSSLTKGQMANISPNTVNARLIVKFEYIFSVEGEKAFEKYAIKQDTDLHSLDKAELFARYRDLEDEEDRLREQDDE